MAKYADIGPDAERLYFEGNTLSAIAEILPDITIVTLSKWKKKYKWDVKKREYVKQPQAISERISTLLYKLLENIAITPDGIFGAADAISKLVSALNRCGATENLAGIVVTGMNEFLKFVNKTDDDPKFKEKLVALTQQFFEYIKKREYTGKF